MKHCAKKLLGLAFALALCLAVGGTALAETPVLAEVSDTLPEQEMLAYEPNVTTAAGMNTVTGDGYTVTIPTTVEVKSKDNTGELKVTAQLKQYRMLNIGIESKKNNWKLAYDGATGADMPKVDYTLTTDDYENVKAIAYYDGSALHYGTGKLDPTDPKYDSTTGARKFATNFSVNVPTPSQATMSGTYSDTLTFTFDLVKQCVTYTINVYEQKLQLTNSGTHVQAVNVVDASGNVTDATSAHKETYVLEYGCADAYGMPLGTAVESDTWTRTRPANDGGEDERCWEDLSRTLTPKADFEANNKTQTINLNLVRKWCWLDVNGITNKATCADCGMNGNQGSKIASFVNIKVSVDDGTTWSDGFWYPGGDDYWGTFPYGIKFQLYLHRVKDGYAYDADADGHVFIYANDVLTHTQTTDESGDGKTHYRVYQGKLEGEPVDKTLYNTRGGGISHAAGSYPRYCYNVCFVNGITYYDANGVKGGREDTNLYHGPHTTFEYTEGMTLADPITDCDFIASDGKEFAGWSTTKNYTAGQKLYAPGTLESEVEWPTPRPGTSNTDTLPTGDGQTVCRTLYAIWKKPYTVKVQFGGVIGWTTWDAANQSFPENNQDGDGFDTAVELGTAYAYGNTSLTLSKTENTDVWNALQAKIEAKTTEIATAAQPDAVWQLKNEYTFTTLPANGEVTIQIKRKRYLLNVIPALQKDDGTYTVADNIETAEQYGKFDLDSCNKPQSGDGKFSYYQWMRNYGGSYRIYNVVPNTGYQFVGLMRMTSSGPTSTGEEGTLTGKNPGIHYFGDTSGNTYTGDTIYVMYKKDMVTFDYNGGTSDGKTKLVLPYDDSVRFPKVVLTKQGVDFIGWSTKQNPTSDAEIFKLANLDPDNGVNPDTTTVSSKVTTWTDENNKVLYAVWRSATGPSHAPAKKKVLTVHYHANFDLNEELALDLDPNPLLDDMDDDFGFEPDPLPEDVLDPTVEAVKTVTYKPDENVVLRHCMFKRGGYVFVGWNTEPDGTGKKYEVNGVPITDWAAGATVDLYAQWKKPEHLKPVVDLDPLPDEPDAAAPAAPPEDADAAFGVDPDQPEELDDAFGADPAALPDALDDAFGVDPALPDELDDAFSV